MGLDGALTVLFIEDDPAIAAMYRLKLEADGYQVTVAADGEQGLKLAEAVPDLIFLDIRLPKIDGFTLLQRLREQAPTRDIPVVILSNYGEEELIRRGLFLGATEYVIKAETTPKRLAESVPSWAVSPTSSRDPMLS